MSKGNLEIHSENILPIIKKWLYSDKDIFVRELVSNACDAIQKVKLLTDRGEIEKGDGEFRVDIKIDKTNQTLTFSDNGIGMDAEEVRKYIAQIAFSGAEDFLSKYKTNNEKDQFIGHFGLGFYSAYMVADKVEINTLSYKKDAEPAFWSCDGSSEYLLEKGTRASRGTDITLFIDKEDEEYLEDAKMSEILKRYCSFLPVPVYLNDKRINPQEPLWIKAPSECTTEEYLEFYRHLYPMQEDPLFWVHLNVDYPFHLKGILYFPKIQRNFDMSKNSIKLYCNRVFVSDQCKDVIPEYLMVLRGIIDSPDIPLNVSRSYLQMDRTVRQLASHISKKVSDSLSSLYKTDREKFISCWDDVSMVVKLGIVEDEKFYERSKEFLIWRDTDGNWTTLEEYLERNREKTKGKVLYTKDEKHTAHFLDVYRQKGVEVLCASSPIDPYLINYLEPKISPATFQRIDGAIDENILDTSREKNILDAEGKTEAAKLAEFIRSKLDQHVTVEAKSLASDQLPGFIMIDENQRRLRDYMISLDPSQVVSSHMAFAPKTFVVNTNNPLISVLPKIDKIDAELAADVVKEIYELALLSQREMDPAHLNDFIGRSNRILEKLVNRLTE
jgi:molecular chaperone HtpG